ncbi:unnamed protein product [Schistosoma mattheei]|uniref:Uncharacterized protein n=1 Tax=Schistosoma mattheei TaxID=31246 RepID=A0A3P8GMY5_9TREM|nr:unnamed protein product [Schistosoma mattheei]
MLICFLSTTSGMLIISNLGPNAIDPEYISTWPIANFLAKRVGSNLLRWIPFISGRLSLMKSYFSTSLMNPFISSDKSTSFSDFKTILPNSDFIFKRLSFISISPVILETY